MPINIIISSVGKNDPTYDLSTLTSVFLVPVENSVNAMLPTFRRTLFMAELKRSHDKGAPYLKPHTMWERSIFILTQLQELLNAELSTTQEYQFGTLQQKYDLL